MCRSRSAGFLTATACALGLLAVMARAQDRPAPAFQVSVQKELITRDPPFYRVFVTAGAAKFAFLLPDRFHVTPTPERPELILNHPEGGIINISLLESLPYDEQGIQAAACRKLVLEQFPTAKITLEFSRGSGGKASQGFDVTWKTESGVAQSARVVFIPAPEGVLVLKALTTPQKFLALQGNLNKVIGTMAMSVDGKLNVITLSDKI